MEIQVLYGILHERFINSRYITSMNFASQSVYDFHLHVKHAFQAGLSEYLWIQYGVAGVVWRHTECERKRQGG
jgi:hypothetical protein